MFATILGGLPRPSLPADATMDQLVEAAIRAQESAGLEPLVDGGLRWPSRDGMADGFRPRPVDAWRSAQVMTSTAVKSVIPGPYSFGWRILEHDDQERLATTRKVVRGIRAEIRALAEAGCPLIEVEETEAYRIGTNPAERKAFRDAHLALTDGVEGTHLSLAIVGGNADTAGIEAILVPAYASMAVDVIAGPDNWRLVAQAPTNVGIVAGAMAAAEHGDEAPEVLLFAARYAASTQGRGSARVGLAIAPGLEKETWDVAVRKMNAIGNAARIVGLPPGEELAQSLDPRAIDIRSAGLGRREPRR